MGLSNEIRELGGLRTGQDAIADVRGCINASPNTTAAVAYAVECGAKAVLLTALYHNKEEDERPTIFLISPYIDDYRCLAEMTFEEWFTGPHKASQIAVPDGLPDLALIAGLDEVWLNFLNPPEQLAEAWELACQCLPPTIKVRLLSTAAPTFFPAGAEGADPTGSMGYKFIKRPKNLLNDMSLNDNPGPIQQGTFSIDGHPCAQKCLIPLP